MTTVGTMMRTVVAAMILSASQLHMGGLVAAEARVANLDGFAEADAVIMLGGIANRKLQQDVQFDDGQVSVNGAPIATVDTGPDGGQITGVDGSVVGFGPDGAGGELSEGSSGGVGNGGGAGTPGAGIQTSEGTGIGVGTDGAGIGTSGGTGIGVSEDGITTGTDVTPAPPDTDSTDPAPMEESGASDPTTSDAPGSGTTSDDRAADGSEGPSIIETNVSGAPERMAPLTTAATLIAAAAALVA